MKKTIYLVRHGETDWNVLGKHMGRTNLSINETGKKQAEQLAPFFAKHSIDKVLVSPLQRCVQTCTLAGFGTGMELCEDIMEWDYGAYEGHTHAEIQAAVVNWSVFSHGAKNGESVEDVVTRAQRVKNRLLSLPGNIAVFSHGHFLRTFLTQWVGISVEIASLFSFNNACVSILQQEEKQRYVSHWNLIP